MLGPHNTPPVLPPSQSHILCTHAPLQQMTEAGHIVIWLLQGLRAPKCKYVSRGRKQEELTKSLCMNE